MAMESFKLTTQMIDLQKQLWDNWNTTLNVVEKQTNSTVNWVMDHAFWIPNESRKSITKYWSACFDERLRFKTFVDEGFMSLKKSFSETDAPVKPKSQPSVSKS